MSFAIFAAACTSGTGSVTPGTIGTPAFCISSRARVLEPIASIADAGGPMKVDPRLLEPPRERGVLGEEAVAGVDGLRPRLLDHLEDLVHDEVGLRRGARAEQVRLGGALDVLGVAVGLGVDGDGRDAELVERADHAYGDLAPVGDEDLGEHGGAGL